MLGFFRKYQRYFFLFITVVIVISFSFFGTYNNLPQTMSSEQVAFIAVDGKAVTNQDVDEMMTFIASDSYDKLTSGGMWGPNFLNDGVLTQDFFQTGLAQVLVHQFANELAPEYDARFVKEKNYTPYVHPKAPYISVKNIWGYFAPEMNDSFRKLTEADNPLSKEAFDARVNLYLTEKRVPPGLILEVLQRQVNQNPQAGVDPSFGYHDLVLFGYRSASDWFSPQFLRLAAQFIINGAKVAQQYGYEVTKAEAIADLQRNADTSFQAHRQSTNLAVANSQEYLKEQLRRMHLDQSRAVKLWRQVLLFRRLMNDVGSSALVDANSYSAFTSYAKEPLTADIFTLPQPLQLNSYRAFQKFELYLTAIAADSSKEKDILLLPKTTLTADAIAKKHPELVQKQYRLQLQTIDRQSLAAKVPLKEMWNWQVQDSSWVDLKKEFPELGLKPATTRELRFAALDTLDNQTRKRVDSYTRQHLVDIHPEWVSEALSNAPVEIEAIGLPLQGKTPLKGITEAKPLIALLDQATIGNGNEKAAPADQALAQYTSDNQQYYRFVVLERSAQPEVLTFKAADRLHVLDNMLDKVLQEHYTKVRDSHPELFKQASGNWAPFADVKDLVADFYFSKTLKALQSYAADHNGNSKTAKINGQQAAAIRLQPYVASLLNVFRDAEGEIDKHIAKPASDSKDAQLNEHPLLVDQWKLERKTIIVDRSTPKSNVEWTTLSTLPLNGWSKIQTAPNGELAFFKRVEPDAETTASLNKLIAKKVQQAHAELGNENQRRYANQLISDFKTKGAFAMASASNTPEMTQEL